MLKRVPQGTVVSDKQDNDGLVLLVAHHGALQLPFRHLYLSSTSSFRPRAFGRRRF